MDSKLFTFGLMTFNQRDLVVETLNSILYQKIEFGKDIEVDLIVTDDHSSDNTPLVIDTWLKENQTFFRRVIRQYNEENKGTVINFNYIIDNAEGNYLKVIAGDDVFSSKNIFEECYKLDDNKLSTYVRVDLLENKLVINQKSLESFYWNKRNLKKNDFLPRFRSGGLLHTPSTLNTKNNYLKSKAKDLNSQFRLFEDDPTWYSMIKNNKEVEIIFNDSIIVLYRVHSRSTSNQGAKETPFSKELRKLKGIYMNDCSGIERLRHRSAYENWPKYLSIDRIHRVIRGRLVHFRLMFDSGFCAFVEDVKLQIEKEQEYYNSIKDGVFFNNNARI